MTPLPHRPPHRRRPFAVTVVVSSHTGGPAAPGSSMVVASFCKVPSLPLTPNAFRCRVASGCEQGQGAENVLEGAGA